MLQNLLQFQNGQKHRVYFFKNELGDGFTMRRTLNPEHKPKAVISNNIAILNQALEQNPTTPLNLYQPPQATDPTITNDPDNHFTTLNQVLDNPSIANLSPEQQAKLGELITQIQVQAEQISQEVTPETPKTEAQRKETKGDVANTIDEMSGFFKVLAKKISEMVGKVAGGVVDKFKKDPIETTINTMITLATITGISIVALPGILSLLGVTGIVTGGTTVASSLFGAGGLGTFTSLGLATQSSVVAMSTSLVGGATLGYIGDKASNLSNAIFDKIKGRAEQNQTQQSPTENPDIKENVTQEPLVEEIDSNIESREQLKKTENIQNLELGTVIKAKVLLRGQNYQNPTSVNLIVKSDDNKHNYLEMRDQNNQDADPIFTGYLYADLDTDTLTPFIIQENTAQALYNPSTKQQFDFYTKSFEVIPPTQTDETASETTTSTETTPSPETAKLPDKIYLKNSSNTIWTISCKDLTYTEKNRNLDRVAQHLGLPSKEVAEKVKIITKGDGLNKKYDLDFSTSGFEFTEAKPQPTENKTEEASTNKTTLNQNGESSTENEDTHSTQKPEPSPETPESQTEPQSEFMENGLVRLDLITAEVNTRLKNWDVAIENKSFDTTFIDKMSTFIGKTKNSTTAHNLENTKRDYQRYMLYSNIYDKIPQSVKNLAKNMMDTKEYEARMMPTNSTDTPTNYTEVLERYNLGLSVEIALNKLGFISSEAIADGKNWYEDASNTNRDSLEIKTRYAMGQKLYEDDFKSQYGEDINNLEIRNYIFDQLEIMLEKDGPNTSLTKEILDQLKHGDKGTLTNMKEAIQQQFGEMVAKVLTGKSVDGLVKVV